MDKILIKDLSVSINEKPILNQINLEINKGDVVAIIGPNGNGKSTLLKSLMKHFSIDIDSGDVFIDNESIADLETFEIAKKGVFFAPQYSEEIPGVLMLDFLKAIVNSQRETPIKVAELFHKVERILADLKLDRSILKRFVNDGFSGGEKKKSEILQMLLLDPTFVLLDEIDSGLDIDSLKIVINELKKWMGPNKGLVVVSHQQKIFDVIKPNKVIVIIDGKIQLLGGYDLLTKINHQGYEWIDKVVDHENRK
ncbi:MAG: Fe-S cluster assembly ATPase SufC [Mycoplasmoidaceae bacterium]